MKRILINATHAEEIRVALCNGNHLYDFDLENRTREQKKANIYKGHVTRVEPSLEAVFVEYGSARQGFLPIREIASDYLSGDPRSGNIKNLIKEGDELIVQIEKEERGNKGAALSTFVSLAGRYLVLMPNNPRGGGISRQISGKLRDEMKQILSDLRLPKGMSVIIRTAGIGKSSEDLQQDLDHLLTIWKGIQEQNKKYPSPRLVHQEAGVVTRAVRDYLRDDIAEIWVDNENAYNEAANFIEAVMPQQASKLRKYTDFEPMFARFGIEKQIETAYQREVRLPSGGSIVIDQTEALVSIDINSSKATKGADVSETAYNTNLEAADEIARQLRLRDMGGLIVIDFIDMATSEHQKQVENRLREATKNDRARIQFAEISRFGLLEMSRQRLRPSLEEATGFLCPRCHGNGMIRDLRSLALSIMRQIEQKALLERQGEVQAEVPTEIAAFLLNEKRESLVYLEQDSGVRITILPHAHLESPNFTLTYNREGFAPTSYERISESEQSEIKDRGYDTNWHTEQEVLDSQIRQTNQLNQNNSQKPSSAWSNANAANTSVEITSQKTPTQNQTKPQTVQPSAQSQPSQVAPQPNAVAWLSNLFAPTQQATLADTISSQAAAAAIEDIVNAGGKSLGIYGQLATIPASQPAPANADERRNRRSDTKDAKDAKDTRGDNRSYKDKKDRYEKEKVEKSAKSVDEPKSEKIEVKSDKYEQKAFDKTEQKSALPKREPHSRRDSRGEKQRHATLTPPTFANADNTAENISGVTAKPATMMLANTETVQPIVKSDDPKNVTMHVIPVVPTKATTETIQLSLDGSKAESKVITEPAETALDKTTDKVTVSSEALIDTPTKSVTTDVTNQVQKVAVKENLAANLVTMPSEQSVAEIPVTEQSVLQDMLKAEFQLPTPVTDIHVTAALPVMPAQGRAKNDPREVYKHFMQSQNTNTASEPVSNLENGIDTAINSVAQTAQKITGTVGQFIDQHLPDTVKDSVSVVSHFLEAMNVFGKNQTSNTAPMPVVETTIVATADKNSGKFDEKFSQFFRNYGFSAIATPDLEIYHSLRQPQNRYVCEAGTNDSQPTPPTQRASNDPRGQVVTSVITPAEPTDNGTSNKAEKPAKSPKPTQKANKTDKTAQADTVSANYPTGSTGEWIVAKLGKTGQTMIADGKLVEAFLQASQANINQAILPDNPVAIPTMVNDTHALISETAITATEKQADQLFHADNEIVTSEANDTLETLPEADNVAEVENGSKSKTSPSSYKNMIESVAEQMSMGQSTILKLSTAKPVPKSRVRKEKTADKVAIKAPVKPKTRASKKGVESAVVTKVVKKEADVPSEINANEDGS